MGPPIAISDNDSIFSPISVSESGSVVSITVNVVLTHTFFADLDITLTSPDGTVLDLSSDNGGGGDINGTISFNDIAEFSIQTATAPFSPIYKPEQPLSTFAGEDMSGTWTLQVADDGSGDSGTLQSWSLGYCFIPGVEEGEGTPEFCSGESGQNLPKPINDNDTSTSVVAVGEKGEVVSLVVSVNLTHGLPADLDILLRSPDGTVIELSTDNGEGDSLSGTVTFDDTAATSVVGVPTLLAATYRPEQPLSTFAGERMSGLWQLQVSDDGVGSTGTFVGWSMSYCYLPGAEEGEPEGLPEGEPAPVCSGESGQNLPKPIFDSGSTESSAFVGETGAVSSIVLSVSLDHTFIQDLDISLISPDGTALDLSSDNGPSVAVDGTITFSDSALTSIESAGSPITGTYAPEEPLSTFAGERMSGQWRLLVVDDASGDVGTLQGWSMSYCYVPGAEEGEPEGTPDGEPNPLCSGEGDFPGPIGIVSFNGFSATILVPESGVIDSISTTLDLTHDNLADLDLTLESPGGTIIELSTDNGNGVPVSGPLNFVDSASATITDPVNPASGLFRPEQALSIFNGESLSGLWILRVEDDASPNTGVFTSWSLSYCYTVPAEGEGEGVVEGAVEGEGVTEGEGLVEGEGIVEGVAEGEGIVEGAAEGEVVVEGEGVNEGEGVTEGEGIAEGEGEGVAEQHSADQDGNARISLTELLRLVQIYNLLSFGCDLAGEDGYSANSSDESCVPHASDYDPQDWSITLNELIRLIQFYNANGFESCVGGEDGYCPITV